MNEHRKGELYIVAEAVIWSLFPIITLSTYQFLSPITSLAWTTLFASIFFLVLIAIQKKWHELTNWSALINILWVAIFIGIGFYGIYFIALKYTSPGNASLIALMEVFYSYLFFHVLKKDYISKAHLTGAFLMIFGAAIVLLNDFSLSFSKGDVILFFGCLLAPIGNYYQQRARKQVSSITVSFGRSFITSVACFIGLIFMDSQLMFTVSYNSLLFLLLNGFVILGLNRILFLEGIHRISVTKATALASVAPLLTLLFAYLFLNQPPTNFQLLAIIPMAAGMILLSRPSK